MASETTATDRTDPRELVREFERVIASTLVLEERLTLIAQRICEALDLWECDLYEYSAERDTLTGTAFWCRKVTQADRDWVGTVFDLTTRPAYRDILMERRIHEDNADDPALPPEERALMEQWGEKTTLTVPLVFGDEVIGCLLLLEKRRPRHFADGELLLVEELAVPAAIAIHNVRLYREQEERTRRLSSVLEASRAITSTLLLDDVLATVSRMAGEALDSDQCLIYEYDSGADAIISRSLYDRGGASWDEHQDLGAAYPLVDYPTDRDLLEHGEIIEEHVGDPDLPSDSRESMEYWGERACLNVPLLYQGEALGLLVLIETSRDRRYTAGDLELVRGLGEQAAIAIHNARLFRRRDVQNQRLVTLLEASRAITGMLDASEVVERVTREVGNLFPGVETVATLWLRLDDDLYVPFQAGASDPARAIGRRPDALAAGAVRALGPRQQADPLRFHRMVVPLVLNRRAEGYLDIATERVEPFTEDEAQLVQILVNQAAVALENADNYGRLESMYLETVTALAAAMEAKDHYTAEHADMLASMALSVGRFLGLEETELRELQYAAVLHDIGKIGVPGHILNKPDRLTEDEFSQIAQHTIIGERIISRIEYLEPIAHIIRAAHERWDGGGYPDRIAGEAIPLAARILLVCDAYHAMTSTRPYREAMPADHALRELESNSGTQFDPGVVDVFLKVWPDFAVNGDEPLATYTLPVWRRKRRDREARTA